MTLNRVSLADGQEHRPTDQRILLYVPSGGSVTFETRQSAGSDFWPLPVMDLASGVRTESGPVGAGTYLADAMPNGTPTIRGTGGATIYLGHN